MRKKGGVFEGDNEASEIKATVIAVTKKKQRKLRNTRHLGSAFFLFLTRQEERGAVREKEILEG